MKKTFAALLPCAFCIFLACETADNSATTAADSSNDSTKNDDGKFGMTFDSQVAYGEHLVKISGCGDCHTPKKMGDKGPMPDMEAALSGHPAAQPAPPFDQKEAAAKGLAVTQTLSAWTGPWGTSYAANITSDSTGIGNWTLDQFKRALKEGVYKGLEGNRPIMPPMPIEVTKEYSDEMIEAMFAYLKSTKPVKNVVPAYQPPAK